MSKETIKVPDIGGDSAEVIELLAKAGTTIAVEQSLLVLESDKASMEVPAPIAGTLVEWLVKEGDSLSSGDDFAVIETAAGVPAGSDDGSGQGDAKAEAVSDVEKAVHTRSKPESADAAATPVAAAVAAIAPRRGSSEEAVSVPDIGTDEAVEVIELSVAVGDTVAEGDSLLVLESDKASMEVPAPRSGEVLSWAVKVGDTVRKGDALLVLRTTDVAAADDAADADKPEPEPEPATASAAEAPADSAPASTGAATGKSGATAKSRAAPPRITEAALPKPPAAHGAEGPARGSDTYAGPAVRKLAREFGIDLARVSSSGPRGRLVKEDLHAYVQQTLEKADAGAHGGGLPAMPDIDFSAFGPVQPRPLTRIEKVTAANMQRSWLNVPHVTQWDEADITELEAFRADLKVEAERRKLKLTPLPFLLKACAIALRDNPRFNTSLTADGENLVQKHYIHIGMAVDTPAGLMVPVIRDVDQKSLWELSAEVADLAAKARDRKLKPQEMQGGCFSISSLGAIGGQGFTPIVNTPEVGILGVSKAATKPVWDGKAFVPRTLLPLTLSYDHRVANGGDAGRFLTQLVGLLGDIRRLLL